MYRARRQFTRVKGVSDIRRLPRLGKIRLGAREPGSTGNLRPVEKPYFVVPPEVAAVYGEKPVELDILFPVDNPEVIFPQSYSHYGSSAGLKCQGDGERACRVNEDGVLEDRPCPCALLDQKKCHLHGRLCIILPRVNYGGIYEIGVSSFQSIVNINSAIDYVSSLLGRCAMVPLKLKRSPREAHREGRRETHYQVEILLQISADQIERYRQGGPRLLTGAEVPASGPVDGAEGGPGDRDPETIEGEILCPMDRKSIKTGKCESCDRVVNCTAMNRQRASSPSGENGNGKTVCIRKGRPPENKIDSRYCRFTCRDRRDCLESGKVA